MSGQDVFRRHESAILEAKKVSGVCTQRADGSVRMFAVGDIFLGDHYFTLGHGLGTRVAMGHDPFREISDFLHEADICVGNLEVPLGLPDPAAATYEKLAFVGPETAAGLLKRSGFSVLSVANNHILQHGASVFVSTLAALLNTGITVLGALSNGRQRPVVLDSAGLTFGMLAYSFIDEVRVPDQRLYAHANTTNYLSEISTLAKQVDHVIVSVHWGTENTSTPSSGIVALAVSMADAGARVILGHHPHWFQRVEMVGPTLIAYSLGDFVFDLFWDARSVRSAVLDIRFSREGVVGHQLHPIRFDRDYIVRSDTLGALRDLSVPEGSYPVAQARASALRAAGFRSMDVLKKLCFFLLNMPRGNTAQKFSFLKAKLLRHNR